MKTSAKSVSVNAAKLLDAFEFVSAGLLYEHSAAICIDTGRIYLASSMIETDEDLPFGEDPPVADGIFLRTWRSGESIGLPREPVHLG